MIVFEVLPFTCVVQFLVLAAAAHSQSQQTVSGQNQCAKFGLCAMDEEARGASSKPSETPGGFGGGLAKSCQMAGCPEKVVFNAKKTLQLCRDHLCSKEAMLVQAGKSPMVQMGGGKVNLRDYLADIETKDPQCFIDHLAEFCQKILGMAKFAINVRVNVCV